MSKNNNEALFHDFPAITTGDWEQQIAKDLKGADYDKRLIWKTLDGIAVRPYYRSEDLEQLPETGVPGQFPFIRGTKTESNSWLIRQDIPFVDSKESSERINYLISRGVQSVGLVFTKSFEKQQLSDLFEEIQIDKVELNFQGAEPGFIIEVLKEHCEKNDISKETIRGSLGYDPIGAFILSGKLGNEEVDFDQLAGWIRAGEDFPNLRIFEVNAKYFHNAGSTAVQELGFALALANEYLDQLTDRGLSVQEISSKLTFNLAVGSNYFFELAKLRSARGLWSRMLESYDADGAKDCSSYFHAETSAWNKTVYDPHVNLLRTTTEAMSSILGGVDSLTILPFDSSYRQSDEISQRLARNQQLLLREEAYLDKVVDPAAGSYYIENLTHSIIQESWKVFQEIETEGGFVDAFLAGKIQDAIAGVAQKRDMQIALKKEILLGTNQYPNAEEKQLDQVDLARTHASVVDPTGADTQPLNLYRGAEGFEKLRFETEQADKQPVVFLLTIGNLNMRKARATFAANFFACAGYKIIDNPGFASVAEGMEAARDAKADIIVLCSSDEEYLSLATELVKAPHEAEIVIAGYPKSIMDELHNAGIRHFIHLRSNVLEVLKGFNQLLEISQ
ncbi:MAG: methylmalonyl-CoA mutase family protein [Bacteroidota bacterium]|nr:methylmalonyl-CoA mutase family protein [Bacteroidota bacterium]